MTSTLNTPTQSHVEPEGALALADILRALPVPEGTQYPYELVTLSDRTAYVAGQIPKQDGTLTHTGKVGQEVTLDEAVTAARICAQQALSWLNHSAGGLANLKRILRLTCYVAHDDTFEDISAVANGASNYFNETLGKRGQHVRAVIGVRSLPRNAPVLIEVTAALRTEPCHLDGAV